MSARILQFHILVTILQASGSYYKLVVIFFRSAKCSLLLSPFPKISHFKENQETNWSSRQIHHLDITKAALLQTLEQAGLLHVQYSSVTSWAVENLRKDAYRLQRWLGKGT